MFWERNYFKISQNLMIYKMIVLPLLRGSGHDTKDNGKAFGDAWTARKNLNPPNAQFWRANEMITGFVHI